MNYKSFVRGFFLVLGWLFSMLPIIYALIVHQWLWLVLIIVAQFGVAIYSAFKKIDL